MSTAGLVTPTSLGLPTKIRACLFDLDGVLTPTAKIHAAAWKQAFDAYLRARAQQTGEPFVPFDQIVDYNRYVDGKPRMDGARSFLESRGIELPTGTPDDPPGQETVTGISNLKNELVIELIRTKGVKPYPGSMRYLEMVAAAGMARAVVSSSANCRDVLHSAGLERFFEVIVDGVVIKREHLAGKPAPDSFLAAARHLAVEPGYAAVFEDALAGVAAGRAGHFGLVVGVNRLDQAEALRQNGADVVVSDLAELLSDE